MASQFGFSHSLGRDQTVEGRPDEGAVDRLRGPWRLLRMGGEGYVPEENHEDLCGNHPRDRNCGRDSRRSWRWDWFAGRWLFARRHTADSRVDAVDYRCTVNDTDCDGLIRQAREHQSAERRRY